ncbi:DUF4347 domain-containing protein [Roseateles amylovorans]|uniref:DUF4347 domain-containing protein n=1 Tax=Roseateles amylovorans TaxID=2978473 RepID=A0ABY6ATX3_9BURK|nr:DUF4347 domain-containing protein [Roseateles amylovorans]UXH76681.1 DUF4347 domain-containing protein [Roseateles amylovorans]
MTQPKDLHANDASAMLDPQRPTPRGRRLSGAPMMMALEPRLMFDASVAAVGVVVDAAHATAATDATHAAADLAQADRTAAVTAAAAAAAPAEPARHEVVFIDSLVANGQALAQAMPAGVEVVFLEANKDGFVQMAGYLSGRHDIDSISLISHGSTGAVKAGSVWLTSDTLAAHADALRAIGSTLSPDGDLMLYGCKTGAGNEGQALLAQVAALTGADVAGSSDNTGGTAAGGNWALERVVGQIETAALSGPTFSGYSGLLAGPTSQLFDTVILDGSGYSYVPTGQSSTFEGWTFSVLDRTGSIDPGGQMAYTNDASTTGLANNNNDKALVFQGSFEGTTGQAAASLKSATTDKFRFVSITVESFISSGNDYVLVGYLNGVEVSGARQTFTGGDNLSGGTIVSVSGNAWNYLDEIRIMRGSGQTEISLSVDDLMIAAPVAPNAAPMISSINGDSVTYVEKGPTVVLDAGANAVVTDTDNTNFDGGLLSVNIITNRSTTYDALVVVNQGTGAGQIGVSGSSVTFGGMTFATFTGGTGNNSLDFSLNSFATPTAVQALIRTIGFSNSDPSDPVTATRTISWSLTDGSGGTSTTYTSQLQFNAVNDAPTLTGTGRSPTFTEGGSRADLFNFSAVSTVEQSQRFTTFGVQLSGVSDGSSESLSIDGSIISLYNGNVLGATANNGLQVSVSVSGGVANVTVSSGALLTNAATLSILNGISYSNSSDNPTAGPRVASISYLRDNGGTANGGADTAFGLQSTTVTVAAVNDAPILTTSGGSASFVAGDNTSSTPVRIDGGLTVSDVDSTTISSATVSITNGFSAGQDQLNFVNDNSALYGNVTASFNAGTGVMTLSSSGATATLAQWQAALRQVYYANSAVSPNATTRTISFLVNDGTDNSLIATRNVTVTPVDQTPLIDAGTGTGSYTEGDPQVAVAPALSVSDLDNATLSSASVAITGNLRASEDLLGFINDSSATYGNIVGVYNASTGVLTLSSAGSTATVAHWQAALRSVYYVNTSNTPEVSVRTLSFQVNDGQKTSATTTRDLQVSSLNNVPGVVTSGGSAAFVEGNNTASTPVVIDAGLTLNDPDNPTLASASVAITGNFRAGEDLLSFINASAIQYGNIIATYDASTGVLSLSSAGATATLAQWQAALRSVTYGNSSESPDGAIRTVSITVNDGVADSLAANRDVTVTAVNDTPVLAGGGGTVNFVELDNAPALPVNVGAGLTVSDLDSAGLASAVVAITGNFQSGQDLLGFANTDPSVFGNIAGSFDPGTGVLSLSSAGNTATAAQWQAALQSIVYLNSSEAPNTATRVISVTVNDGQIDSNTVTRSISITSTNDTPLQAVPPAQQMYRDASLVFGLAQGNPILVADMDAGTGLMQVTLTASQGTLSLSGTSGLSFSVGTGTGDATMTFQGNLADVNAALNGLRFAPTAGFVGSASLQVSTDDLGNSGGPARTVTDVIAVTVDRTNPVVSLVSTNLPDGGYKVGDTITTTVRFDQVVTVDTTGGTPTLLLETGAVDRQAVYVSGSGTDTLTFSYVVQAGDVSARLDYASSAALTLNGGTVRGASQFDALLGLPAPGGANALSGSHALQVDGVVPTISRVDLPAAGTYVAGQTLDFTVHFTESLTVDASAGAPRLSVTLDDGSTAFANYVSGSGSTALVFRLTVASGQQDANGIALGALLDANGARLRDAVGNEAARTLSGVPDASTVRIDAVTPVVDRVALADGSFPLTGSASYLVTFSENVRGVDASDFALLLTDQATGEILSVVQVDGRTYRVEVGGLGGDGSVQLQLKSAGNGITDLAGNALSAGADSAAFSLVPPPPPLVTSLPASLVPLVPQTPVSIDLPWSAPITFNTGPVLGQTDLPTLTPVQRANTGSATDLPVMGLQPLLGEPLTGISLALANDAPPPVQRPYIELGNSSSRGLQATPSLGGYAAEAGRPLNISLPFSMFTHSDKDAQVTVDVRLANGRPLPAWLRFDPVTGTLVGNPPAGLNQRIVIDVIAMDAKGNRAVSRIEINVGPAARSGAQWEPQEGEATRAVAAAPATRDDAWLAIAAAQARSADADLTTAPASPAPVGRSGLSAQFDQHGAGARQAERSTLLQHLQRAVAKVV